MDYHDKKLAELLNKHAPKQQKQVVEHPVYPWYTPQILERKCRVRKLQRKADKYRHIPSCTKAYKAAGNSYIRLLQLAKRESINVLIKSFSGNVKKSLTLLTI